MAAKPHIPAVGAMDPELRNSPIIQEFDEDADVVGLTAPDESVCYFNGREYGNNSYVRSGDQLLKCRDGVWIEAGPGDPLNP
ncbi:MAG TPA: hypothetical protein VHK24_10080 [Steroidobacter sp.]|nr:hypothetical protein [Steroidobacter sp.]